MDELFSKWFKPNTPQWEMSSANNEWGMSLPTSQVDNMSVIPQSSPIPSVQLGLEDSVANEPDWQKMIEALYSFKPTTTGDPSAGISKLTAATEKDLATGQVNLFTGAVLKSIGVAGDFFSRATGLAMGQLGLIDKQRDVAIQGYQNQMESLDNQVLYLKNQLADRFNKTVETNIMQMAARNIRVTSGGVLDLTKDQAQEITEDISMAESNARLKKIALGAAQDMTKESAKYAKFNAIAGFVKSAANLGMAIASGGGTGESWGSLYAGYQKGSKYLESIETQEFNKLY